VFVRLGPVTQWWYIRPSATHAHLAPFSLCVCVCVVSPRAGFEKVAQVHFYYKRDAIKQQCRRWLEDTPHGTTTYTQLLQVVTQLNERLDALEEPVIADKDKDGVTEKAKVDSKGKGEMST
jgi:hypothetical protein